MKINSNTPANVNRALYMAFSEILLDIEGSNIDYVGWIPSEEDRKWLGSDYEIEKKKGEDKNSKVIFKNIKLQWAICECGGEYPCSCGNYVYEVKVVNEDKVHYLTLESEYICFDNGEKYGCLPIQNPTIFDFIRMCQLCDIELELSDYGVLLLSKYLQILWKGK